MPLPQSLTPALEAQIRKRKAEERKMQAQIMRMMGPAALGGQLQQAQQMGLGQLMMPQPQAPMQQPMQQPQQTPAQMPSAPAPTQPQQMAPQPGASVQKQKQAITR